MVIAEEQVEERRDIEKRWNKNYTKNNTKPIEEDKENMLKRKVIMESDEYNEP